MDSPLDSLRIWARLERQARLDADALAAFQLDRLRRIVAHAERHVALYRRLFAAAGIQPESLRSLADLQRLPIVRRVDLQTCAAETLADDVDPARCVQRHTGGSSGRPLTVVSTRHELTQEALLWLRTWRRLGLRWHDKQVTIKDPEDAAPWNKVHWFQRLGILRVSYLDVHAAPEELARALVRAQPDVLRAPPSVFDTLRRAQGASLAKLRPRRLFTTSELLDPLVRARLETAVRAPVHDIYGATEAGCIAWGCPRCDAYHVNADAVLVEVVRDGAPVNVGDSGEVVVTNLVSRAMPFIRYALGDVAERGEPCPAAPGLTTLRRLRGRSVAPVVVGDGSLLSPYSFMPDDIPGVAEYRIVQEAPDSIRVVVVAGAGFEPESLTRAERECRARVGRKCRVVFERRDSLPPRNGHDAVVQERSNE